MPTEKGWAVVGPYGLYTGWWMTRKAAIEAHVSGKVLGPSSDRWVRTRRVHDVWEFIRKRTEAQYAWTLPRSPLSSAAPETARG